MALTIEDGTNVTGANSYITVAEARAYAALYGVTFSATDADVEVLAHKAIRYIESKRGRFQGCKTYETQALQFPRTNVILDGYAVDSDEIPDELKQAQYELMAEINAGEELDATISAGQGNVIKERIEGALEVQYDTGSSSKTPTFTRADALLKPLYKAGGGISVTKL